MPKRKREVSPGPELQLYSGGRYLPYSVMPSGSLDVCPAPARQISAGPRERLVSHRDRARESARSAAAEATLVSKVEERFFPCFSPCLSLSFVLGSLLWILSFLSFWTVRPVGPRLCLSCKSLTLSFTRSWSLSAIILSARAVGV